MATCNSTNTTFLLLDKICIHSDHSGVCGTAGQDKLDVILRSKEECAALCCANLKICAAFLW